MPRPTGSLSDRLPIHGVVGEVRVLEGEGREQAGVRQIQFELPQVDARRKTRARVVRPQQRVHGLGHAAHEHVKPEVAHESAVEPLPQWPARGEGPPKQGNRGVVATRPPELIEVHRAHLCTFLLTGNEDISGVPAYRDERSGPDVVVTAVLDELFDSPPHPKTHLNLV